MFLDCPLSVPAPACEEWGEAPLRPTPQVSGLLRLHPVQKTPPNLHQCEVTNGFRPWPCPRHLPQEPRCEWGSSSLIGCWIQKHFPFNCMEQSSLDSHQNILNLKNINCSCLSYVAEALPIHQTDKSCHSAMFKCQSLVPTVSKWTPWFEAPRARASDLLHRAPAPAAHSGSLTTLCAVWELGDVWRLLHWPPCPGTKPKGTRTTQQFSFHYLLGQLHETSLMGSGLHVLAEESESSTCSPFFTELFVESNFLARLASTVSPTPLPSPLTKEMWLLGGVYWFHKRGKGYIDVCTGMTTISLRLMVWP